MTVKRQDIVELVKELHRLCIEKKLYREGSFESDYIANESLRQVYAEPFLALQDGSPTDGRAWRLNVVGGAYGTGHSYIYEFDLEGGDYLGWTKAEAYNELKNVLERVKKLS